MQLRDKVYVQTRRNAGAHSVVFHTDDGPKRCKIKDTPLSDGMLDYQIAALRVDGIDAENSYLIEGVSMDELDRGPDILVNVESE